MLKIGPEDVCHMPIVYDIITPWQQDGIYPGNETVIDFNLKFNGKM